MISAFFCFRKNRVKLKNKARQSYNWANAKAKHTIAVWLAIQSDDDKSKHDQAQPYEHQTVILFGKREG